MARIDSPPLEKHQTYLGQALLKRSGVKTVWTKEMFEEYIRCADDPIYFIKTYCRIVSLDFGEVPFAMWPYQEEMVLQMHLCRFLLIMLPRQMGKTQVAGGFILHEIIFNKNYSVAVLANKDSAAREVLDRVQFMYTSLPSWLQHGVVTWNKGDIKLDNGSKIFTAATSVSAIRGKSVNLLYLDEFAHVENDVEFWASTFPTISSGQTTKVLITSTPKGMNLVYKLWSDSQQKLNSFKSIYFPWTANPTRDAKWEKEQLGALGPIKFRQEVSCDFLGSAGTLISGDKLQKLAFVEPLIRSENDEYRIYAKPVKGRNYIMCVDTSEGVGGDYSVVVVIDVSEKPFKVVAIYRNNQIAPEVFTGVVNQLGKRYNDAFAVVETNSVGYTVAKDLWFEYEYENMLRSLEKQGGAKASFAGGSNIGVKTTKATKRVGCSTLKSLIETDLLIVQDFSAVNELSTFIAQGTSWGAEEGKHDDVVMCLVIFAWFTQQTMFDDYVAGTINAIIRQARHDGAIGLPDVVIMDGTEDEWEEPDPIIRPEGAEEDEPVFF